MGVVERIEAFRPYAGGYNLAPVLIFGSATLWSLDALFRPYVSVRMEAERVVWWEHVLCCLPLTPMFYKYAVSDRKTYSWRLWASVLMCGIGADALGNTLLTKGYSLGHVALVSLLQQTQPIFGLIGANILLGEKIVGRVAVPLCIGALLGLFLMMWPFAREVHTSFDPASKASSLGDKEDNAWDGLWAVFFGMSSAALWATETVLGRYVLEYHQPSMNPWELFTFRQFSGLTCLTLWVHCLTVQPVCGWVGMECNVAVAPNAKQTMFLSIMATVELISLSSYLVGLKYCSASVASIMELAHPLWLLTAIPPLLHIIDPENVFHPLEAEQYVGAGLLVLCATALGIHSAISEGSAEDYGRLGEGDEGVEMAAQVAPGMAPNRQEAATQEDPPGYDPDLVDKSP